MYIILFMKNNVNLNHAKITKNDEFYTSYSDIEKEMSNYKKYFIGKTIYCNCDNPYVSNFTKYFINNFNSLKLKRLICTSYDKNTNNNLLLDIKNVNNIYIYQLEHNGDFRNQQCIDYIKQADIIITNPPFSLFRDFINILLQYKKDFIILGNLNAVSYKNVWEGIMSNNIHIGYNNDSKVFSTNNNQYAKLGNTIWFTSFITYHPQIQLEAKYNKSYSKYVNFNAIEVNRIKDIPCDYIGLMGVPVSFMLKYNPSQFEIIGSSSKLANPIPKIGSNRFYIELPDGSLKRCQERIVIRHIFANQKRTILYQV